MNEAKIKNISRWCYEKIVDELAAKFRDSPNLFIAEFSGLKVNALEDLRTKLRKNASSVLIVKNSLACLAFKKAQQDYLMDLVSGQTGVVLGGDDPVSISRVLVEFGKKFSGFQIKGGVFSGEPITINQIKELSQLPPRPALLAKVCSSLKSPISRLVYSLGLINKLALILKSKANQAGQMKPVG